MPSIIPLRVKIICALLLALILIATGYWKGYSGQHDALVAYRAEVATASAIQAQSSKTKGVQNDQNTKTVATNYAADSSNLNAVLDGLRKPSSNRASSLSGIAIHPEIAGASGIQQAGAGQVGKCDDSSDDPCLIERGIFDSAMRDAQAWESIQDWLVREEIPVK